MTAANFPLYSSFIPEDNQQHFRHAEEGIDFIQKPFSARELGAKVNDVLRKNGGEGGVLISLSARIAGALNPERGRAVKIPLNKHNFNSLSYGYSTEQSDKRLSRHIVNCRGMLSC